MQARHRPLEVARRKRLPHQKRAPDCIVDGVAFAGRGRAQHVVDDRLLRNRRIARMADSDPQAEYELLRSELAAYSAELPQKPHCVIITKSDILAPDASPPRMEAPQAWGQYVISSVARRGLDQLLEDLWQRVRAAIEEEDYEYDEFEEEYRP